jgi:uncharacterized Ntn-hydrolase superfamily protein
VRLIAVSDGGHLAERMLIALEAAQAAADDIRGKLSAALVEVAGNVYKMDPNRKTLAPRLVVVGLLPDKVALKKILGDDANPAATDK